MEQYVIAFLSLYLHGSSAVRLILDERPVTFDNDKDECDELMLWRYFYRHSGVTKLLFHKHIGHRFTLRSFQANERLDPENYFYITLEGAVRLIVEMNGIDNEFDMVSGYAFPAKHLHSCMTSPMLSIQGQKLVAWTVSECRLYVCSARDMKEFTHCPWVKDASQGLLTAVLSDISVNHFFRIRQQQQQQQLPPQLHRMSTGREDEQPTSLSSRISPLFQPLQDYEIPKSYLAGGSQSFKDSVHQFLYAIKKTLLLPWPLNEWVPGLRQVGSLPIPMCEEFDGGSFSGSKKEGVDKKMLSSGVELTDVTETSKISHVTRESSC